MAWDVLDDEPAAAHLTVLVEHAPFFARGHQRFGLRDGELLLALLVENHGQEAVPAGIGIHPWFRAGELTVPADAYWPGQPVPTGEPPLPVDHDHDLRMGLVPPPVDCCFTHLTAPSVKVPGATLSWDGPVTQVVVYTGKPGWAAVEPVTMATNGFELARIGVLGHGVQILAPGEQLSVTYRFARSDL